MSFENDQKRLIINYLPQEFTDRDLYDLFCPIGPIETCRVMKDNKTNYSFGFGFVTFSRIEDASMAIHQLNGTEILNKRLKVSHARPSTDDIKDTNLYISNLPKHFTDDDLECLFGKYGQIVQKNILKDKITGMPRGVAFVRFDRKDSAQQAILALNGYFPEGGTAKLNVKIAEEHGKKKAQYLAGYQAGILQRPPFVPPQIPPMPGMGGPNSYNRGRGPQNRGYPYPNMNMGMPGRLVGAGIIRPDKSVRRYNPMPPAPPPPSGIW